MAAAAPQAARVQTLASARSGRRDGAIPRCGRSLAALVLALSVGACAASLPPVATPTPEEIAASPQLAATLPNRETSLKLLVIGDSGTGGREQYEVAAMIARAHARFRFDTAIMLGDNLYGLEGARARENKFEKPYKPLLDAGVTFHASLGNHDNPSQRFYPPFNMNGRRYYAFRRGPVEFFALDSTDMTNDQVAWVARALAESDAPWKVAYMHHPFYSSGERHGPSERLRARLEPLFVQHGVDVVFAGHEHFYERIAAQQGIAYFIQGGAAKLRRGNIRERSSLTLAGFDTDRSFTLVEFDGDEMHFETIARTGTVVDRGSVRRRDASVPAAAPGD